MKVVSFRYYVRQTIYLNNLGGKSVFEIKNLTKNTFEYIKPFFKWLFFALVMGTVGGVVGAVFHKGL